jgi:hypothetical protein
MNDVTSSSSSSKRGNKKCARNNYFYDYEQRTKKCSFSNITGPVASLCGSKDGIVDPTAVQEMVPNCVLSHIEPEYEHLDMIWADDVKKKIFTLVLGLLKQYRDK